MSRRPRELEVGASRWPGRLRASNHALIQADGVAIGIAGAVGPFLPVFLVRLGASGAQVGLLTSIPAVAAFLLALPIGHWLQRRRNIVPWFSRSRLLQQLAYAGMAIAVVLVPSEWTLTAILAVWAVAMLPNTVCLVAFPILMDAAAGPRGRYDLLSRRWSVMGLATAVTVVAVGQLLGRVPFPTNYELFLVAVTCVGGASYWLTSSIRIPNQAPAPGDAGPSLPARIRQLASVVGSRPSFLRYELRAFIYVAGTALATPLVPLFYVREIHAPDAWIGIIGAGQAAGALLGYTTARTVSRRWGGHAVLLPALLAGSLVPVLLSVMHDLAAVAALAVLSGFFAAGANLALFDELLQRIPRSVGVTFSSVDQTIQNLALVVAPIAGGLLATEIGIRSALEVAGVVALASVALFALDARARGIGSAKPDPQPDEIKEAGPA
jgi:hypothetical protein